MSPSIRRRRKRFNNFIMIPRKVVHDNEWKKFSAAAKILYILMKCHYNGRNNGNIQLHYSSLRGTKGLSSPSTISRAFRELEVKGWIRCTNLGGLFRRFNVYQLTGKVDDYL